MADAVVDNALIELETEVFEEAHLMAAMLGISLDTFVTRAVRLHINERLSLPETTVRLKEHADHTNSIVARLEIQARAMNRPKG